MKLATEEDFVIDTNRTQTEYNTITTNLTNFKKLIKTSRFSNLPNMQLQLNLAERLVDALLEFTGYLQQDALNNNNNNLQYKLDHPSQSTDRHPKSVLRANNGLSVHINYDDVEETKYTLLDLIERTSRSCAKMNDGTENEKQTKLVKGFIRNLVVKDEGCIEQRIGKSILFVETGTYDLQKAFQAYIHDKTEEEWLNPANIIFNFYDLVNCKVEVEHGRNKQKSELSWQIIKDFFSEVLLRDENELQFHDEWISFYPDLPRPEISWKSGNEDNYQFSNERDALCYLGFVKSIIPEAANLDIVEVADTRGLVNAEKPYGFILNRSQKQLFDQKINNETRNVAQKLKTLADQSVQDLEPHTQSIANFLNKIRIELQKLNPPFKKMHLLNKVLDKVKETLNNLDPSAALSYSSNLKQLAREISENGTIDEGIAQEVRQLANSKATVRFGELKISVRQNIGLLPVNDQALIDAANEVVTSLETELTNKGTDLDNTLLLADSLVVFKSVMENTNPANDIEHFKKLKDQAEKLAACSAIDSAVAKNLLNYGIALASKKAREEIVALQTAVQNQNLQQTLPALAQSIAELITEIENDLDNSKENFDNTLVLFETLTKVRAAIENKDSNLHNWHIDNINTQAEKVSGASSLGWKIAGILTIIAGILVGAIAGTAATVLSIGSIIAATPVAPIAVPLAIGIGVGGGLTAVSLTALGAGFFYYGRQKGVSSKLANVGENLTSKTYPVNVEEEISDSEDLTVSQSDHENNDHHGKNDSDEDSFSSSNSFSQS